MLMDRLLANRRGVALTPEERARLESTISEVRTFEPLSTAEQNPASGAE
ncbi:hypothetical protein NX02_02110 [Sphingomonas sanxanigenens DSM 19645 = NX02]|uniref:Uncharacterized protein n=1 Tax=Sphingomonas sanxanigenens DSM 19645 = NX02 TaxID=1123269 RepID=W0A776_9SPHN|nr:hypothetical protein NX02_02110 [Sphingomonas sanxanigenens DSM 19645 = NX02]